MNSLATENNFQAQHEVQQVLVDMINNLDSKNWDNSAEAFAETVFVDYSSMSGQPGSEVNGKELVAGWKNLLNPVSTHHMLSNFAIELNDDGDEAEVYSHVYASHEAEGIEPWDIYGRYQHKLRKTADGWKIHFMKLLVHGQRGNKAFLQQVMKKSKTQ